MVKITRNSDNKLHGKDANLVERMEHEVFGRKPDEECVGA